MPSDREIFLERVRQAVAEGNRAGISAEIKPEPGIGYQGAGADIVSRFAQELAAAGGHCHIVDSRQEAALRVMDLVKKAGAQRVLLSRCELLERLNFAGELRVIGVEVWQPPEPATRPAIAIKDSLFAADVGITGVDWLIAETGSIVLSTQFGEPRSLSLLPPVHIAVAERRQLLPDLFDWFARWNGAEGLDQLSNLPACVSFITGPSKTGDIELRLVTGVHGPGEVHVVLIAEP